MPALRPQFDRRLVVVLAAVLGGAVLFYVGRHLWFFGDEWDFLLHRSVGSVDDLLRPHNEHWVTLPIVVYRVLFSWFSVTSYTPYFVTLVALHVALASVVGILLLRVGAPLAIAAFTAFGLVTFGPGGENLLWSFQITFIMSLLAGVIAFVLLDAGTRRADRAAGGFVVVALVSSGAGVPILLAIVGDLLLRREFRRAVRVTAIPAAIYGLWLVVFGSEASSSVLSSSLETILALPAYVRTGLSTAVSGVFGFGADLGFVGVLLVALLMASWAFSRGGRISHVVACSVLAAVLMYVATGTTRAVAFGVGQAISSRYVHMAGVLLVLACGSALFQSRVWARYGAGTGRWWLALVVAAALVANLAVLREFVHSRNDLSRDMKSGIVTMVGALDGLQVGEFFADASPIRYGSHASAGAVLIAVRDGSLRLPSGALESVESDAVEQMRILISVRIGSVEPLGEPAPGIVVGSNDVVIVESPNSCLEVTATDLDPFVVFDLGGPGWLSVDMSDPGLLQVFLEVDGAFSESASLVDSISVPGSRWVEIVGEGRVVRIDPPGSGATICFAGEGT